MGVWIMLSNMSEVSVGDIFAGTVVLRDPGNVLPARPQ